MKSRSTAQAVTAGCGMLLILVTSSAAVAHGDDEACAASTALRPYIDPAVRYHRRPVADDDNAYPLLVEATTRLVMDADPRACGGESAMSWRDWPEIVTGADTDCIDATLDANAPALEEFDRALSRPDLQFPLLRFPTDFPQFALMRRLAVLKLERAKARQRAGDRQGSVDDVLGLLRYARLFEAGDGPLIHFLVGLALDADAMAGARWYAAHPNADAASLNAVLRAVALNEQGLGAAAAQAYRVEFNCFAVRMSEQVFSVGVGGRGGALEWFFGKGSESMRVAKFVFADHPKALDPPETLRLASACVAAIVMAAPRDVGRPVNDRDAGLRVELAAWPERWNISVRAARKVRAALAAVDNPIGKRWVLEVVPGASSVYLDNVSLSRAIARGTSTLLALRLYELRSGELPATLSELVSEGVLSTLPVDPYSGAPLGYQKFARAVWSAGPEKGPNGGAGCARSGQHCLWSLPDAFDDRTTLPRSGRSESDTAAEPDRS